MQFPGEWRIGSDDRPHRGELWAWGEWEPESRLIRTLDQPRGSQDYPRFLWQPYYVPRKSYRGLHNTDPFVFGKRFLYSNCHQKPNSGLVHLGEGSVIAFGSCKKVGGERWWIDTVFVVRDFVDYNTRKARTELKDWAPDTFLDVTAGPLSENCEAGCAADERFRLYRGATPDDPVDGMFSFFPAMSAGDGVGFPRPVIDLPSEYFNRRVCMPPKGVSRERSRDQLHRIWRKLVKQVREAELVLGTHAALPERREP